MLARIWLASLVQANGRGWSFQLSMNAPMVSMSWRTEVKEPRRMAWRLIQVYFSVIQGRLLVPDDFADLGILASQLLAFEKRCNAAAAPFDWKFTRTDLNQLLSRLARHDPATPLANPISLAGIPARRSTNLKSVNPTPLTKSEPDPLSRQGRQPTGQPSW